MWHLHIEAAFADSQMIWIDDNSGKFWTTRLQAIREGIGHQIPLQIPASDAASVMVTVRPAGEALLVWPAADGFTSVKLRPCGDGECPDLEGVL